MKWYHFSWFQRDTEHMLQPDLPTWEEKSMTVIAENKPSAYKIWRANMPSPTEFINMDCDCMGSEQDYLAMQGQLEFQFAKLDPFGPV